MNKQSWQAFPLTPGVIKGLTAKLKREKNIFSFAENPLLASLITCLGLQSEMGDKAYDRLSVALGVKLEDYSENPWSTELISFENKIGIRMWIEGKDEFYPDHPDFSEILHSFSLNAENKLNQIVIFPEDVARNFKARGLELVIVKPWVLSSFLAEAKDEVNYFKTNLWEIELNSAFLQTEMMSRNQVAFSGTHDLVDHLLCGNGEGIGKQTALYNEFFSEYQKIFNGKKPKRIELVVSYLIGVLLDDLAQPKWYKSDLHREVALKALRFLSSLACYEKDQKMIELPLSFHRLVELLRAQDKVGYSMIIKAYNNFIDDLLESTSLVFSEFTGSV